MKTKNTLAKRTALIAVLILGHSAWLSAQDTNQWQIGPPESGLDREPENRTADLSATSQSSQLMKINKCSSLIGSTVKNQQGEELGKIRDVVIDFNSDRVAYLVLDSETGFISSLFTSQKLHAVPLRAFQPDSAGTSLVLRADKAKLELSESFDKNNWPAATTAAWGAEPFWKDTQGPPDSQERQYIDQQITKELQNKVNKDGTIEPKNAAPPFPPGLPPQP